MLVLRMISMIVCGFFVWWCVFVLWFVSGFFLESWSARSGLLQHFQFSLIQNESNLALRPFIMQTKMQRVRIVKRFHFRSTFLIWTKMLMETLHALLKIDWSQDRILSCIFSPFYMKIKVRWLDKLLSVGLPLDTEKVSVLFPKTQAVYLNV